MTDAEAVAAADRLALVVDGLREDVKGATAAFEKSSRRTRWFVAGLAVLVIAVGGLALQNHSTANHVAQQTAISKAQADCQRVYLNANAARSNVLLPLSNDRADALDEWIRALPDTAPKTPGELAALQLLSQRKRLIYLKASDAYQNALQTNPLPLAPKYAC